MTLAKMGVAALVPPLKVKLPSRKTAMLSPLAATSGMPRPLRLYTPPFLPKLALPS
jgi:hypothetical protein